ncbi:Thioredoxin H-type [Sesamum angolense]|uniref:Thioredoxin H-type n=1 Tax=Sesamum angolense TaxID=2727404 RepID=A0AAE1T830_9LAMI|nr:Thioredoxin H-type [Sesamum angolense]
MATSDSEGQVIGCHTVEAWNQQLQKGNENKQLQDSCGFHCFLVRTLSFHCSIFRELAKKLPNVTFLKVDVDELKTVASDWAVEAMPTFIFLKEGKILERVVGAKKEELQQTLAKHLGSVTA